MLTSLVLPDYTKYDPLTAINPTVYLGNHSPENIFKSFKIFLLELKVEVEKWDAITHGFIFHEDAKSMISAFLKAEGFGHKVWGSEIIFVNDLSEDQAFAFYVPVEGEIVTDTRYISMGILPYKKLQKMCELKAFW